MNLSISPTSPPHIMGILNLTPDSFSDGGQFLSQDAALRRAEQMLNEGVDIIDVGGESTRPGAQRVSEELELARVIPVLEKLRRELAVVLSVDTSKPKVMQAAIDAGVDLINDVNALQQGNALEIVANSRVKVCLMHKQGEPQTMQQQPFYKNVVSEVRDFLQQRAQICQQAGITAERILIDPGFGFGKTVDHNLQLLRHLPEFTALPYPVLLGVSRKSTLGAITGKAVDQRLYAGLAVAALAFYQGVKIIRTHDVAATRDVLKTIQAILAC
ncbi:dihydropteroate synthase [Thioflexithrix psekupsensis]|uniref:Dihydropteroate synthase n=1 Tax=Thioflexithrix psekupsensis TaxID=1570016 RepID=A0A251XD81_9GAMM|nr:dihydropteroate synthase [Thioflexithrix psekupsensis]OUD16291.1 dihydropteroate synthase [Thioflexithrix psekupsensis]